MITRCPACQTAFRVSVPQLAARDGQVRCGACAHVFDARTHLLVDTPIAAAEPPPSNDAAQMVWPELDPAPVVAAASELTLTFGPTPQTPLRRAPWIAGSLVLLLLLAAQGLFHFRSDIALLAPESKPLLEDACAMLGCTISLPQRSALMSIEASDLQADGTNPNVVILTATLRNRAAFAQVYPALELTLTDSQDLPLVRRVLQASDYLDTAPDRENGFAAGAERAIRVTLQLADIKATGYRLYLFYP